MSDHDLPTRRIPNRSQLREVQGSTDSTYPAVNIGTDQNNSLIDITPTSVRAVDATTRRLIKTPDGLDPVLMSYISRLSGSMVSGANFGRYNPINRLGAGSQGVVWTVTDRDCQRDVAFKLLPHDNASPEDVARFVLEAQITAQLEHPGIVPVHDVGKLVDGTLYYSMKRVEGEALADHLTDRSGKAEHHFDLLQIFLSICQTMSYAHSRGVVHRDLKPRNIMVGRFGEVLIMDWGLAKIIGCDDEDSAVVKSDRMNPHQDTHETMLGTAVGTPAYMSPEQAAGETNTVDHRCDVYSLGVILYEMLSGLSPYDRGDLQRLLKQARDGTWHRLDRRKDLKVEIPKPLVAIVQRAMAKERTARYQSVELLAKDVRAFLAGRPISAYRESILEILRRWRLAHKIPVRVGMVVTTAAVCIGLVVYGITTMQRDKAADNLRRTARQQEAQGRLDEALGTTQQLLGLVPDDPASAASRARLEAAINRAADDELRRAAERERVIRNRSEAGRLTTIAKAAEETGTEAGLVTATEHYMAALGLMPEDTTIRTAYEAAYARLVDVRNELRRKEQRSNEHASADYFVTSAKRQFQWADTFREQMIAARAQAARLRAQPDSQRDRDWSTRIEELESKSTNSEKSLATQEAKGVEHLENALRDVPEHPEANRLMADWAIRALRDAERREDHAQVAVLTARAKRHDLLNRYTDVIAGVGSLALSPGSLAVSVTSLNENSDRILQPVGLAQILEPGDQRPLPSGRWLIQTPTSQQAIYITRGETKTLTVTPPPPLPNEVRYIPESTLTDRNAIEFARVNAFAMQRYEVTCGDYLLFLNDPTTRTMIQQLPADGPGSRYPRLAADRLTPIWMQTDGGRFELRSIDGSLIPANIPITNISLSDALAYAGWRSAQENIAWRLPTHLEWQAAVQSGDFRRYPWGTRFDSRLCLGTPDGNDRLPGLEPIGSHPFDVSVYQVYDLAGSVAEWVAPLPNSTHLSWAAGGSYRQRDPVDFATEALQRLDRDAVSPTVGFRLALSLP